MEPQVLTLRCPRCGDMVPVTAQFCGNCGERITEEMKRLRSQAFTQRQDSMLRCPRCGNMMPTGSRFCRNCGSKVVRQAPASQPPGFLPSDPASTPPMAGGYQVSSGPVYTPPATQGSQPSASSPLIAQPVEISGPRDETFHRSYIAAQDQSMPSYQFQALPMNNEPDEGSPIAKITAMASKSGSIIQHFGRVLQRFARLPGRSNTTHASQSDQPTLDQRMPAESVLDAQQPVIPTIDRVSAKTLTNVPLPAGLIKSLQSAPSNPPGIAPKTPSTGVAATRAIPIIIPQPQPDGPGAPLPRNQKKFRRRIAGALLAALLVLVVAGGIVIRLYTPAKDPTLVMPTQLGAFPAASSLAASSLAIQPNWSEAASSTIAAQADKIASLPTLPSQDAAAIDKGATTALAGRLNTLNGLGQAQMNVASPMDVSMAGTSLFVVEAVDGGLQIVDTKQEKVLSLGFVQFFRSLMQHSSDVFGEPRVIFDPTSQLWVLAANEVTLDNGNVVASYFDIAISTTSSPLSPWHVYQFSTQTQEYGGCNWGDDPRLGSNSSGFFLSGSIFNCGIDGVLKGVVLWELPKAPFAHGKSGPTSKWVGFTNTSGLPLLSLVPAVEAGATTTEWLVGNDGGYVDNGRSSQNLIIWAVTLDSSPRSALAGTIIALPTPYADPPQARQPSPNQQTEPSQRLSTGDARVASAQYINGHLYTAFTTAVNWQGDSLTRSGIYWVDLTASLASQTMLSVKLIQAGILGFSGAYTFMPVLVADGEGNSVLVAQISSSSHYPGIVYSSRSSTDPLGQMGGANHALTFLQEVSTPFGTGSDHWGDYAGGSLVFLNNNQASPDIWIAAPVIDPASQSGQETVSWHTSMWEFTTGGSTVQNIE